MAPKSETIPLRTEVAYEPSGLRTKRPSPKSETIPLRTEVAYEPRFLRTKRPSPNGGLGNWNIT